MEEVWVVVAITLILSCFYIIPIYAYRAGYRAGANRVLSEWKNHNIEMYGKGDDTDG